MELQNQTTAQLFLINVDDHHGRSYIPLSPWATPVFLMAEEGTLCRQSCSQFTDATNKCGKMP